MFPAVCHEEVGAAVGGVFRDQGFCFSKCHLVTDIEFLPLQCKYREATMCLDHVIVAHSQ